MGKKNQNNNSNNQPKPDNRSDNVENIQKNINYTIKNMELADEMIATTSDQKMKQTLKEKNERREKALGAMRCEIKDEAKDQKNSK